MSIRLIDVLQAGVQDGSGQPLENGTVTIYDSGTTTRCTVYQDYALTTAHANPLTLDSEGKVTAYTDQRVKLVIRDADGVAVETIDNVGSESSDYSSGAAAGLAGNGLTAPGDGTIAVNADGTTLEVAADVLRIKDAGVSTAKVADAAITAAKLASTAVTTDNAGLVLGNALLSNCIVTAAVASSALTVALKTKAATDATATDLINVAFRSSTLTSGAYVNRQVTAALSVVVSSGSTLGHQNAAEWPIYVYLIDNAGTVELAVSTSIFDDRFLVSTTAEGGAGGADSPGVMYSTTARTNVAARLIAVFKSTQTTAGTWAAVPTAIAAVNGNMTVNDVPLRPVHTTVGIGGIAQSASSGPFSQGAAFADVTNLSVTITTDGTTPVRLWLVPDGTTTAASVGVSASAAVNSISGEIKILRGATSIAYFWQRLNNSAGTLDADIDSPPGSVYFEDDVAAGTYTYKVQAGNSSASTATRVFNCKLRARQ